MGSHRHKNQTQTCTEFCCFVDDQIRSDRHVIRFRPAMPSRIEEPHRALLRPIRNTANQSSVGVPHLASHRSSSLFPLSKWTRRSSPTEVQSFAETPYSQREHLCAICLRDLNQAVHIDLECGHQFHSHCLKQVSLISHSSDLRQKPVLYASLHAK